MRCSRLLVSAICLISIFVLMGQAEVGAWYGVVYGSPNEICVQATCKSPAGDVKCEFTLVEAQVNGFCYNYVNSPNVADCTGNDVEATGWTAAGIKVVASGAAGSKNKRTAVVDGCLSLSVFSEPCLNGTGPDPASCEENEAYQSICHNSSPNWTPVPNSFWISSMEVSFVCTSLTTGKVLEVGTQECSWPGEVDQCSPEQYVFFDCVNEILGKKPSCEFADELGDLVEP